MSNPEMSAVERYLLGEQARANVAAHLMHTASPTSKEGWVKDERGPWRWLWLSCTRDESNPDGLNVYFCPEGDRYIVTDLGEGVRPLRMRTGCYLAAEIIADRIPWPEGIEAQIVTSSLRAALRCDGVLRSFKVAAEDLPKAICATMLASFRVANLEIK